VAYLLDGVEGKASARLPAVSSQDLNFARPWLPSLASLPQGQTTRMPEGLEEGIQIRLWPEKPAYRIRQSAEWMLEEGDLASKFRVELACLQGPLVFASAELPPQARVAELQGSQVARWQVVPTTQPQGAKLEIWLKSPLQLLQSTDLMMTLRQPTGAPGGSLQLSMLSPRWDSEQVQNGISLFQAATGLSVRGMRWSGPIREIAGPWPDAETLCGWLGTDSTPSLLSLQPMVVGIQPSVQARVTWMPTGLEWRLQLKAAVGQVLPPSLELRSAGKEVPADYSFEAEVPVAARPFTNPDQTLTWSIHPAGPWKRLSVRKRLSMDEHGTMVLPQLTMPQYPQLQWPQKLWDLMETPPENEAMPPR
jgi:hypothetical protein